MEKYIPRIKTRELAEMHEMMEYEQQQRGESMAKETLEKISAAEQEAEMLEREAEKRAAQILETAQAQAQDILHRQSRRRGSEDGNCSGKRRKKRRKCGRRVCAGRKRKKSHYAGR